MRGFWLCPTIVTAAFGKYKIVGKFLQYSNWQRELPDRAERRIICEPLH
jgi:hypothetical protein